jgi:hypothetical protein
VGGTVPQYVLSNLEIAVRIAILTLIIAISLTILTLIIAMAIAINMEE